MDALPRRVRIEVVDLLDSLQENPFQHNSQELRRTDKAFRIYVAGKGYRVVYRVNDHKGEVLIGRIRPRSVVYRGLRNP